MTEYFYNLVHDQETFTGTMLFLPWASVIMFGAWKIYKL